MSNRRQLLQSAVASGILLPGGDNEPSSRDRMLSTLNLLGPQKERNHSFPKDPVQFIRDVLGIKLWDMQEEIVYSVFENRFTSVASGHSVGKGLSLDTPLPTPSGWTTMGEVKAGDWLIDEQGFPCRVVATSPIHHIPCYRVEFDDGSSLITDEEHRWSVLRFLERKRLLRVESPEDWRDHWGSSSVVTTPQLADMLSHGGQSDASIPYPRALQLPDSELPIDPYIFGCWLGDGASTQASITTMDQFILDEFRRRGATTRIRPSTADRTAPAYHFEVKEKGYILSALREMGVFGSKRIPMRYLRASERQRRELLAGILDTDGTNHRKSGVAVDFCNEELARDVAELIRSLGYEVNVRIGNTHFKGRDIPRWRMFFTPDRQCFLLPRKKDRWERPKGHKCRTSHRMIRSVTETASVPTKCVMVDSPRNLYLAGREMIPTHNSFVTAAIVITFLHLKENSIVISTAPTGRQVEHILWRNIRTMYKNAKRPLLGNNPLTTRYDISESWYAMGFKPTDADTDPMQGFHAESVLAVVDEAAGVMNTLIDGMTAAMTPEDAHMLMIGNPTSTSGPFYDSHHTNADMFNKIVIAWPDTPNYKEGKTAIKGLITQQWVDEVLAKYGEESAYYQSRVMAVWVSAEDVLIPLKQIERAKSRDPMMLQGNKAEAGLDVARDGKDRSVLSLRKGDRLIGSFEVESGDSFRTADSAIKTIQETLPEVRRIKVDVIGLGAGVVDALRFRVDKDGLPYTIIPVNFSKKPADPEKYMNQRCEAYGLLADRFRVGEIGGNIHEKVVADLSDIRFSFNGRHTQPVIEDKSEFRKRVGHSPDFGDSTVLAFYNPPRDDSVGIGALAFGYADVSWGRL